MPPTMGGVSEPYESGQSGTESPASLEVTKAPAISRKNVQHAVKTAKRCTLRLRSCELMAEQSSARRRRKESRPAKLRAETLASGLEGNGYGLRFLRANRDRLLARPVLFVPCRDGVRAGRNVLDLERSVFSGDLEVRVAEHGDIGLHPRVHVALDRDGNFFVREALADRCGSRRLRFVPLAVILGNGVNVVGRRVGVDNLQRLRGLQRQHVRVILAALLVDLDRRGRRVERVLAEIALQMDDHVLQGATV